MLFLLSNWLIYIFYTSKITVNIDTFIHACLSPHARDLVVNIYSTALGRGLHFRNITEGMCNI